MYVSSLAKKPESLACGPSTADVLIDVKIKIDNWRGS